MTKEDVSAAFSVPVGEVFCGKIIEVSAPRRFCYAKPFDDYKSVAARERVDAEELARINGGGAVYPTKKIWLP